MMNVWNERARAAGPQSRLQSPRCAPCLATAKGLGITGGAALVAAVLLGFVARRRRRWLRCGRVIKLEEEEGGDGDADEEESVDARLVRSWERIEASSMKRRLAVAVIPTVGGPGSWDGALSAEFARLSRLLRRTHTFVEIKMTRRRKSAVSKRTAGGPSGYDAISCAVAKASEVAIFFCQSILQTGDDAVIAERRRRGYADPSKSYPSSLNNETTRLRNRDVFAAMAKKHTESSCTSTSSSPSLDAILSRAAPTIPTVVLLHHEATRLLLRGFPINDECAREELRRFLLQTEVPGLNKPAKRRQPLRRRPARPPAVRRPAYVSSHPVFYDVGALNGSNELNESNDCE